ncbi:MAG: aldose 1-epimerase [Castellaniella sp.]|uniref:aldose epimerase family protein n=1 Tax=Castellaniella sp. TaxID=1955812 RepID=UPI00120957AB|nr:aldose 1-epimerase [Castellaniella sp.]TAN27556.1 MAG: aldose 1-epimerase [Castellaniella sp.]
MPSLYDARMNAAPDTCLTLRHGPHQARIAPLAGGRILSWSTALPDGQRDWLVPITAEGWPAHTWPKGGIFPLAPFSNRVRNARLHWQGRTIPLEPLPGTPHALHGQAQAMAWNVTDAGEDHATLTLSHPADLGGWPWAWHLRQTIGLTDSGLQIGLTLENQSATVMPTGLGIHPYFTAQSVHLAARTRWAHEHELALAQEENLESHWARSAATWTEFLSDWAGEAWLHWPQGPGLRLHTRGPLTHLILHCNEGRYLCVEPATHVCDAANLAARGIPGTGIQVLSPGEVLAVEMALDVQPG